MAYNDTAEVDDACFALARATKWSRKPIDASEIEAEAKRFAKVANECLSEALDINPALVARAVRYIEQAHGMPMEDDTAWFECTLRTLLEVARPNGGLDERGREFLTDLLHGITLSNQE